MAFPKDIGIIDCMLGIPEAEDRAEWFAPFRPLIKDAQTLQQFAMPAQYMFKDIPQTGQQDDYIKWTVDQMDKHNVRKAIIDYANTRGADKVIYAGYFPMGLSLDRIMSDMENVPFKDEVWPKFLRDNATKLFKL